jgi:hypothetical protein
VPPKHVSMNVFEGLRDGEDLAVMETDERLDPEQRRWWLLYKWLECVPLDVIS